MTPMRFALVGVLLFGGMLGFGTAGCSAPKSARCKRVCKRESKCSESASAKVKIDESECIVTCTALDRDDELREKVSRHIACVDKADNCEQVASCRTK